MQGQPTGILDIYVAGGPNRTFMWNGEVEDRQVAKAAFESALASGMYLSHVTEAPGKARQVSSWSEVEQTEKEQGAVTVQLTPAIAGGAS